MILSENIRIDEDREAMLKAAKCEGDFFSLVSIKPKKGVIIRSLDNHYPNWLLISAFL